MDAAERIASFSSWHFDFVIDGHHTNPSKAVWQEIRVAQTIAPAMRVFGGSLAGKRVLDLGCNAGYFCLAAIQAGAAFVLGIDGRQMHVDQAEMVFDAYGVEPERYRFVCANMLDFDLESLPPFDLVLCLGVLYHVANPAELLRRISLVNTDLLVIDTKLSVLSGSVLEVRLESLEGLLNAVGDELVMVPTAGAVKRMAEHLGYQVGLLQPVAPDEDSVWKYHGGLFGTFLCAKRSDISGLRFMKKKELVAAQAKGLERARAAKEPAKYARAATGGASRRRMD